MDALQYAKDLVSFNSTSVLSNAAVTDYVENALHSLAFETERLEYNDERGVRKCCVIGKKGPGTGGVAYFGHTDVVPADDWVFTEHGPFTPTVKGDRLYGRGSCDMKGSVAAMLAAASQFAASQLQKPIYICCTSDEEIGYGGAKAVAERSAMFHEMCKGDSYGIIGEPTRLEVVYAHKGTCGFQAISRGRAAHSSTREGINANLAMIPFLGEMLKLYHETENNPEWENREFDPPTVSWNIGINDHTRAINITPPQSICTVYFRIMPGQNADKLIERARRAASDCGIEFHLAANASPVRMDPDSDYVKELLQLAGKPKARTVAYGTDGAMLRSLKKLIVFGPGDIAQAHTHDEWIAIDQLEKGTEMYSRLIRKWCM